MPVNVEKLQAPMKAVHESCDSWTYEWREKQLKALSTMVKDHWNDFLTALAEDLGKFPVESASCELALVAHEINFFLKHLKRWMKSKRCAAPFVMIPSFSRLEARPKASPGVLIIGPFNYPILLTLLPLVGSLGGGNPAVLKPSELTPASSRLLKTIIPKYFEPGVVQVVEGGVPETEALISAQWGLIFFTGSQSVGKIIATAAAKTLTPVVLELGGKCPCVVDETAPDNIQLVAHRIVWAKTVNMGQTCMAPDFLVVHKSLVSSLVPALEKALQEQFTNNPKTSGLGRIVTSKHASRHLELIRTSGGKVICGGAEACDPVERYIAPTILLNPSLESPLWKEEIFGPILPIHVVSSREEAIEFVRQIPGTPLALYVFTKTDRVLQEYAKTCEAASVVRNDCLVHFASCHLPITTLGTSGYGRYNGEFSFDTFTHWLPVSYRPCATGMDFANLRCHPFNGLRGRLVLAILYVPDVPVLYAKEMGLVGMTSALVYLGGMVLKGDGQHLFKLLLIQVANGLEYLANLLRPSTR